MIVSTLSFTILLIMLVLSLQLPDGNIFGRFICYQQHDSRRRVSEREEERGGAEGRGIREVFKKVLTGMSVLTSRNKA